MSISARASWVTGLSLGALCLVVVPVVAQQPDARVQKAAAAGTAPAAAATTPRAPVATVLGTMDMDAVFKGYDKFKVNAEEFTAAMKSRKDELMKLMQQAKQAKDEMDKMAPNGPDYKKAEATITELTTRAEVMRQQAEMEFSGKEAESVATLYTEVQSMANRVARMRGYTHIIKSSNSPIVGSDPQSVSVALSRAMVYSDPRTDITAEVVHFLNQEYYKNGGVKPKVPVATPGATAPPAAAAPAAAAPGR